MIKAIIVILWLYKQSFVGFYHQVVLKSRFNLPVLRLKQPSMTNLEYDVRNEQLAL